MSAARGNLVFNQQVLEYFVDEAERRTAVAEMVRTTRPGGSVVVVVARPRHPLARVWRRVGWPGFIDQPDMADLSASTRRGIAVLTRWLERVPLPRAARRWLGLQLLVVGTKPV